MDFRDFNLRLTKKTELSPSKEKKRKENLFKKENTQKANTPFFIPLHKPCAGHMAERGQTETGLDSLGGKLGWEGEREGEA